MFIAFLFTLLISYSEASCTVSTSCEGSAVATCEYIQTNLDSLCSGLSPTYTVNGPACSVHDCSYSEVVSSSDLFFCCELPTGSASYSVTPRVSSSSNVVSVTNSYSSLPTHTCAYRAYDSQNDFSSVQGGNGWYYGYYSGANFVPFTSYAISNTGSAGSVNSWNYNIASNGLISSSIIMPNGAINCNTPTYGNIAPVLRWYNPLGSCYQDATINLIINRGSTGLGNTIGLTANGVSIYSNTGGGGLAINSEFNVYSLRSLELTIAPFNSNCDYGQTTYRLSISPIGSSRTVLQTKSSSNSPAPSVSGLKSKSASPSVSASVSAGFSKTFSSSATGTSTVFFKGVWTNIIGYNYAFADISNIGPKTLEQCKLQCWLNPLCGVIVVSSPCNTIDLNSTEPNTIVCGECWLKLITGWTISADNTSSSFMLEARVYPPTITPIRTNSVTGSASSSRSLQTVFSYNMCTYTGGSINLPILGSYVDIITNAGTTYTNNLNCQFTVTQGGGLQFLIEFISFATEECCDTFSVSKSGVSVLSQRGSILPTAILIPYTNSLLLTFLTDVSAVFSGVRLRVTLVPGPSSTASSLNTVSAISSPSSSVSNSLSGSSSHSSSALPSRTLSVSARVSSTNSADAYLKPSDSATVSYSYSKTASVTGFSEVTNEATESRIFSVSSSSRPSSSQFNTRSYCSSLSSNKTGTSTASYSASLTMSKTTSASFLYRPKIAVAPSLPTNLVNMSADELTGAMTELGNYDPSLIKENLQKLGAAALFKMDGPLLLATDTFSLAMAKLDNNSAPVSVGPIAISVPSLNVSGAAASSVIQWSSSPYPNSSTDSSVISMSIINLNGDSVPISNLSVPIRMEWKLDIDTDDERFKDPPEYLARCDTKVIYKGSSNSYKKFNGKDYGGGSWLVPCLLGTEAWVNCSSTDFIKNYVCSTPMIVHRCLYWSTDLGLWTDDGCTATGGTNESVTCLCTHLTDFSARIDAVVSENTAIFNNAGNVYSLEGLIRYLQWYAVFGGIGLGTVLLALIVIRIDQISIENYVKSLCHNSLIAEMLQGSPTSPINVYDAFLTIKEVDKHKDNKPVPEISLFHRILIQHSRLGFLFRFDPRLSRLFRLLGICLLQFHSLFITALLYGFTYGAGGKSNMMWYDTILLAIITTSLNIPMVKGLMYFMNNVGLEEFKKQFPLLFAEYKRRIDFEKLGLVYLEKKRGLVLNVVDAVDEKDSGASKEAANNEEDGILDLIVLYLCCRSKKTDLKGDLHEHTPHHLLREMATVVKEAYPYVEAYSSFWGMFPCHTNTGLLYLLMSFGWIGWCLNYLLLFASAHDRSVGEGVMISYAASEISTVFLSQPLIIALSYVFYKTINKYGDRLPSWIKDRIITKSVRLIPAIYYFSDPWVGTAKTSFTSEYAYNIFVKCPAHSTGVSELVYANQKAVMYGGEVVENPTITELKILYKKLVSAWDEILHKK